MKYLKHRTFSKLQPCLSLICFILLTSYETKCSTCMDTLNTLCWMNCPLLKHCFPRTDRFLLIAQLGRLSSWKDERVTCFFFFFLCVWNDQCQEQDCDTSLWNVVNKTAWFDVKCSLENYATSFIWQNNMHCCCVLCFISLPFWSLMVHPWIC